jgi:hypothetical protein
VAKHKVLRCDRKAADGYLNAMIDTGGKASLAVHFGLQRVRFANMLKAASRGLRAAGGLDEAAILDVMARRLYEGYNLNPERSK